MTNCGKHTFKYWSNPNSKLGEYYSRWLGKFNINLSGEEANKLLEGDKLTTLAQYEFIKGWEKERKIFLRKES